MHSATKTRALAGVLAACLGMISTAAAKPPSQASYEQLKESGHRALESGQYDKAISSYRKCYEQQGDARLLYNLGLAHLKRFRVSARQADLARAEDLFSRLLRLVRPDDPRYRAQAAAVRRVRALTRGYLKEIRRQKRPPHRDPVPTTAPAPPATQPSKRTPTPRPVVFVPPKPAHEPKTLLTPSNRAPSRWHWLLYGLAAVSATTAGLTGGLALHYEDEAATRYAAGDRGSDSPAHTANDLALSTDVLLGVAVVSAIVAVVVHYTSLNARRNPQREPLP